MCSPTPRFSSDGSKTVICTCSQGPVDGQRYRGEPNVRAGWVLGTGIPGGSQGCYTGYYPAAKGPTASKPQTAKRAPDDPAGVGSGWSGVQRPRVPHTRVGNPRLPGPPTPAPVGLPGPASLSWDPPRSKRARFHDISHKVSQNDEVSPKKCEKASHSPCFQKRVRKSPLDFLRFPLFPAFSGKELMGHFDPCTKVYCQNDEVSPSVHPQVHAKWTSDTPTGTRSKLLLGACSSSD